MISQIDRYRHQYAIGITGAMNAHEALCAIDPTFRTLEHTPSWKAIVSMNIAADEAIDALARAQNEAKDAGATINVGGDMIQVGDITDSENVAIGKDIKQKKRGET